ncbi:septum formation initiator family protein [Streptomyces sp. NPDC050161]|uniref:septum formation initiator family protein n=1 Tax=Streptomyces sp. NPDC050161 TaxID=3365604 RepID=UPI00378DB3FE
MTARGRSRGGRSRLSALFPSGGSAAARTPFVLLVVVLLGSGLITLLMLNSALNQGSFELSKLEKKTDGLTDDQQALQQEVDAKSAPGALERRARELGMVPGGNPAFLNPDGTVRGKPSEATAEPEPMSAPATPSLPGTQAASGVPVSAAVSGSPPATPSPTAAPSVPVPSASPGAPRPAAPPVPSGAASPGAPAVPATVPSPTTSGR